MSQEQLSDMPPARRLTVGAFQVVPPENIEIGREYVLDNVRVRVKARTEEEGNAESDPYDLKFAGQVQDFVVRQDG